MRFKLSNLFWVIAFSALFCAGWLQIQHQSSEIRRLQSEMDAVKEENSRLKSLLNVVSSLQQVGGGSRSLGPEASASTQSGETASTIFD